MNYNKAIEYIYSLDRFGGNVGLSAIASVLGHFENPQNKIKAIHIAGTNGKGSVAAMISAALCANGYKTGLYISPFIIEFCERIQVNGEYIEKQELAFLTEQVKNTCLKLNITLGQFEFITAIAFLYFANKGCDYVVLETGLGGRLDATNVITSPEICVITSISLDHTAVLGTTYSQIATEKSGIIKQGAPTITCVQHPLAAEVIRETCKKKKSELTVCEMPQNIKLGVGETRFTLNNKEYSVALSGGHQAENATLAIMALNKLGVQEKYIKEGLLSVTHPARMEIISKAPLVILDGAHNEGGAVALSQYLKAINFKGTAIVSAMADKDANSVAEKIAPYLNSIIAVAVKDNPRTLNANQIVECFSGKLENCYTAQSYTEALNMCDGPLLICGSLYLAADIRPMLLQKYK